MSTWTNDMPKPKRVGTVRIQREMLARVVQTWHVDIEELEGLEEDTAEFDEVVCNTGDLVSEETYFDLEDDDLTTLYEESVGTEGKDPRA